MKRDGNKIRSYNQIKNKATIQKSEQNLRAKDEVIKGEMVRRSINLTNK